MLIYSNIEYIINRKYVLMKLSLSSFQICQNIVSQIRKRILHIKKLQSRLRRKYCNVLHGYNIWIVHKQSRIRNVNIFLKRNRFRFIILTIFVNYSLKKR